MHIIEKDVSVVASQQSIHPELLFTVPVQTAKDIESLVFLGGELLGSNNRKMADLKISPKSKGISFNLFSYKQAHYNQWIANSDKKSDTHYYTFSAALTAEIIDYIEELRNSNPRKEVDLAIDLTFQQNTCNEDLVSHSAQNGNIRLEVLKSTIVNERCFVSIPQSKWIHDFAIPLRIGKFMLLELNIPKTKPSESEWKEPIERAIRNLEKVEKLIQKGEWYDAIETSRKVFELFKFKVQDKRNILDIQYKEALKKLFIDVNLSDKGFDEFCAMVENLFNFISKFEHEKDERGGFLPTPVPQREDAYFIYGTSVSLVNMISNKVRRK
jgi:hypothetical protein